MGERERYSDSPTKPRSPGPMKPVLAMLEKSTADYVPEGTALVKPGEYSRFGLNVPRIIFTIGSPENMFRNLPKILPRIMRSVANRMIGYKSLSRNPASPKTVADQGLVSELRSYALSLGCRDIGFRKFDNNLVFSNKTVLYPNAIVLTMDMDKKSIARAPEIASGKEVWRTYDRLGIIVNRIAGFLRKRGYAAQAGAALGGDVNYPLLAQQAGMGWIGSHGLLISPGAGPSQRIAAVFTSIGNLPELPDNPHSWIGDFCHSCGKCIRSCPAQAILKEPKPMPGGGVRMIEFHKCAVPFSKTVGCSVCIRDCVFFSSDYDSIRKAVLQSQPIR